LRIPLARHALAMGRAAIALALVVLLAPRGVDSHETAPGVAAGAGPGLRVMRAWVIEAETRWVRGLTEAYSGSGLQVRNRSREWVLRLSRVASDSG